MLSASNTDYAKFIHINNENINEFIQMLPININKITIWDIDFNEAVSTKPILNIPSLNRFQNLFHFHCYNIHLKELPEFPPNITDITCVFCNLQYITTLPQKLENLRVQHNNIKYIYGPFPSTLKRFYYNNNNIYFLP